VIQYPHQPRSQIDVSNERQETWINICLRDEQLADFVAVKQYLGLQNNTDVIRLLIRKEALAIWRAQALRAPEAPSVERTPSLERNPEIAPSLPQSAPGSLPDAPAGAPEPGVPGGASGLCLACPLPDCDDTDSNCLYQQATGELDRHRAQQRAAVQRKRAARRRRARPRAGAQRDT
jgi:hypothetical protein